MRDTLFWKGKKVLVTGHTGFVGTWLSMVLNYSGALVYGISLPAEPGSIYEQVKGCFNHTHIELDIRDTEELEAQIIRIRPDVIFHLAAFGFIQECMSDPLRAFSVNSVGTSNLMNSVLKCDSVQSLIIASTDKVYENNGESHLFTEDEILGATDPYSASKLCEDITVRSFYETYTNDNTIGMCVVRPSNILGGGDHHLNRLIPGIFDAFHKGDTPKIRNWDSVRPWQDILDMCDAYLFLARYVYGSGKYDIVNVGPEPDGVCTVGEIVNIVSDLYGNSIDHQENDNTSVFDKKWLGLSIERIKSLGWQPKYTLSDTLMNIYSCYEKEMNTSMYDICIKQIKDYYRNED